MIAVYLKGFQSKEECRFLFWNIVIRLRDIYVFIMQVRKKMTS